MPNLKIVLKTLLALGLFVCIAWLGAALDEHEARREAAEQTEQTEQMEQTQADEDANAGARDSIAAAQ